MSIKMKLPIFQIKSLADFDERDVEESLRWFPKQESERVGRYKNLSRRIETAAAYSLLVENIRSNGLLQELPLIAYAESGKPYLENYPGLHFNLSHCRHYVAVAMYDKPVGVDIECRRKVTQPLIRRVCSETEQALVAQADDPDMEFLRLWTRKEAYLKYIGTGIVEPLRDVPPVVSCQLSVVSGQRSAVSGRESANYKLETHPLPEGDGWISICY